MDFRSALYGFNDQQKEENKLAQRELEAKQLEAEHLAEIKKTKEELNVIEWEQQPITQALLISNSIKIDTDNELDSKAVTEPVIAKAIQANSNEYSFSGLLNIPGKVDDWFEVIDTMANNFFNKHGEIPTKAKAWTALWTTPPDCYGITAHEDKNDPFLKMPATKNPLKRSNFNERWVTYTEKKTE